jgi:hypothetical protein
VTTVRRGDDPAEGGAQQAAVPVGGTGPTETSQRSKARRISIIALCTLLGAWVVLFVASGSLQRGPNPKYMGGDFVLFLSAARVVHAGGNPYDQRVLYRAERRFLQRDGVSPSSFQAYMRVGNPPLLFWALQPVTAASFDNSAKLWCLAMYALLAVGFLGCLVRMGWHRRWLPLAMFLALPQTMYAAYYGNLDGVVFAALGWSAALARRKPLIAGALLTLAFLKPQVALPGALLILLFLSPRRLRLVAGFILTSVLEFALTVITTGAGSVGWWLHALGGYSQRLGVQPDIASLSGLYVYTVSDRVRLALEGLSLLVMVVATTVWWWRGRRRGGDPVLGLAWLWIAWFLATPFAHFHDEVVLTLPVLAVVGLDGAWLGRWPANITVYMLLLSIALFPTNRAHTDFQSLTLLVVLGCALVQFSRGCVANEAPSTSEPAWA